MIALPAEGHSAFLLEDQVLHHLRCCIQTAFFATALAGEPCLGR